MDSVFPQLEPCLQKSDHHVAEPGEEPSQPQPQRGPGQPVTLPGGCQWILHPGETQNRSRERQQHGSVAFSISRAKLTAARSHTFAVYSCCRSSAPSSTWTYRVALSPRSSASSTINRVEGAGPSSRRSPAPAPTSASTASSTSGTSVRRRCSPSSERGQSSAHLLLSLSSLQEPDEPGGVVLPSRCSAGPLQR